MGKQYNNFHCIVDGWEDDKIKSVNEEICENCEKYSSRYIKYPLTIKGMEITFSDDCKRSLSKCGQLVKIIPCGEEYGNKTYLGILLGDLPISTIISFHPDSEKLHIGAMTNPSIFIPELKKIVYGCESWWKKIENPEDLKEITTDDIQNTWYVKLLIDMCSESKNSENS